MGVFDASTSPPKERYAVPNDNVIRLIQPGAFDDPLTVAAYDQSCGGCAGTQAGVANFRTSLSILWAEP